MSDQHDRANSASRALIDAIREKAITRVNEVNSYQNPPREKTKSAVELLDTYRQLLYPYRDERALDTPWDERDVDVDYLQFLRNQTTTIEVPSDLGRYAKREVEVQCAEVADPHLLSAILEELNDIHKELGFADEAKRSRAEFSIASPDAEDHPEPVNDNVTKPGQ